MAESIKLKNDRYWDVSAIHGLFDAIYPVGSIYLSVNNTNPGTMFGGTWVAYGDSNTYLRLGGNGSGGSNSVKLAANQIPSLTTGNQSAGHTHNYVKATGVGSHYHWTRVGDTDGTGKAFIQTQDEANVFYKQSVTRQAHQVSESAWASYTFNRFSTSPATPSLSTQTVASAGISANHTHTYTNNSQQNVSVTPQYVQVYAWKRTA